MNEFSQSVPGQFKDDWVIYGFHKRIVAEKTGAAITTSIQS
jgi:hypothetical protein